MLRMAYAGLGEKSRGIYFAFGFFLLWILDLSMNAGEAAFIDSTEEEVMDKMGKGSTASCSCYSI